MAVVRLELDPRTQDAVVTLLCRAFADYPVMRFVLGDEGDYGARLRTLIGFFVANRAIPRYPCFAIYHGPELAGVALCTPPDPVPPTPELEALRERTWTALGDGARARYAACVAEWTQVGVAEPNLHLNMLGVPPRYQGRGLAKPLLEAVHELSRSDPRSCGVTLTTESPANVPLYQHFGYRIVGRRTIAPGVETWGFFRPD